MIKLRILVAAAAWSVLGQALAQGPQPASTIDPLAAVEAVSGLAWVPFGEGAAEQWSAYAAWAEGERERQTSREASEIQALSALSQPLEPGCYASLSCSIILALDQVRPQFSNAEEFNAARQSALDYVTPIIKAAEVVERAQSSVSDDIEVELQFRTLPEQILRSALGDLVAGEAGPPDERGRALANIILRYEASVRDRANTQVLESLVERGWPLRTRFSAAANHAGWLIAQHADRDPSLQVRVLRLFERAPRRTISGRDFAALYDRVHARLDGVQRYGTQWICVSGRWDFKPFENPEAVAALRQGVGLGPLPDLTHSRCSE